MSHVRRGAHRGMRGGGGNRRIARSIPDNGPDGRTGNARDRGGAARRRRRIEVHEYAHDARATLREGGRGYALEAVAALGLDAGSACSRRSSSRSTAGSGSRSCRRTPRWTSRRSRTRSAAGKATIAPTRRGGAGDGLRAGRDQPAGHAPAAADGARRLGGRLADDPRLGRPARPGDRAGRRRPRAAHQRRDARRSPVAAELTRAGVLRAGCRPCAPRVDAPSCRAWRGASDWRSTWRSRSQ